MYNLLCLPLPKFYKCCIMITNIQSLICEINPRGKLTTNVLFYEKKYKLDCCSNAISPTDLVYFLCFSSTSYFYLFFLPECYSSNKILHLRRLWFSGRFERWCFFPFRRTVLVWLLSRALGTPSCSGLTALSQRTTWCWPSSRGSWRSPTTSGRRTSWSPTRNGGWTTVSITWWGLRGWDPTPPCRWTTTRRSAALLMVREREPGLARPPQHDKYEH